MEELTASLSAITIRVVRRCRAIAVIAAEVLEPFATNQNTGNRYEMAVAFHVLRQMGLTDADLDGLEGLLDRIRALNDLGSLMSVVRTWPVGTGFTVDGVRIVDLVNVTQSDGLGKTGDLLLVTADKRRLSLSVCGGTAKRSGTVSKCLTNPTAKRFGCTAADVARFNERAAAAVTAYKAEFVAKYGADESVWPTRVATAAATDACTDVAAWTAERFAGLESDLQMRIVRDLLRIDDASVLPADYLAVVDIKTFKCAFYKFGAPQFAVWAPSVRAEGIWLKIYNQESEIGKVQVKFNNGVYHHGKTSSIHTSWNVTFNLTDVFRLKAL
jgi:hypothetical protein